MIKLLHCADLHLAEGAEKEYGLSVLDEIVELALREGIRCVLFAGDTFNSFRDAESLRGEFRSRMQSLHGRCEAILLSGNHEELGRNGRSLASFDLGIESENIVEPGACPFTVLRRDGVEFMAVPHRAHYGDYTGWNVPGKEERFRVAVAHGIVAGMSYTWQDEETDAPAAVMDADLFERNDVDYAALGHIHSFRRGRAGRTTLLYPGSARVWRKNEAGPRLAALVALDEGVAASTVELNAAGRFRAAEILVGLDGEIPAPPAEISDCGPADYIYLRFSGLVEDERKALECIRELIAGIRENARRVEYDTDLSVLEGISTHPVAKKFLDSLDAVKPAGDGEELRIWRRAREMGLLKIKETIEAGA